MLALKNGGFTLKDERPGKERHLDMWLEAHVIDGNQVRVLCGAQG